MAGENGEGDALQLTEEESRVIQEARAAGVSPGQLLEKAKQNAAGGQEDPDSPLTRAQLQATLEQRDKREALSRARAERVGQMSSHVSTRLRDNPRLSGRDRRVAVIRKQVMDRIPESTALVEAKNETEFYTGLDKLVDDVVTEEMADIDEIAGAQAQSDLDATLDAESEGGPGTGGAAGTAQGDDTSTQAGEVDWADNPVYGLGVDQPSEVDLEKAFQRDVKKFGKKHGLHVSA